MAFDYSKLFGLMRTKNFTQSEIARKIGNSESTLSLKFNNKAKFKQCEIATICDVLGIAENEIGSYFFTTKVQKN